MQTLFFVSRSRRKSDFFDHLQARVFRRSLGRERTRGLSGSFLVAKAQRLASCLFWVILVQLPWVIRAHAAAITFIVPHGPVAEVQRGYLIDFCLLLTIVVLPVLVATPWFAWRYRYGNASRPYRPWWSFSWPLEIIVWGIPFGVVVVLAVWLWRGAHALDPYAPIASAKPSLQVDVVGYDWKWLFIYPTLHIASLGEFALPDDRPVSMRLTTETVMQSFFIPALGSQIYAMAGMVTRLHLKANGTGPLRGENTQYNGKGFHEQKFTAVAMTPDDFSTWVKKVRVQGLPMTPKTYNTIRQETTLHQTRKTLNAKPAKYDAVYFNNVSPNLFKNIVQSFHGGSTDAAVLVGNATANAAD